MEFMIAKLLGFVMVLTRLSAFFLVSPVFSWKSIPKKIKVSIAFLMAIFFSTITSFNINVNEVSTLQAVILISNEAIYGLALGLITMLLFSAVRFGGRIIERQMGLNMAEVLDPLTSERAQPVGMLMEMIFILLFLNIKGHHLLLLIISRSYETFPAGSIPTIKILTVGITQASSALLLVGLKLSAPILATFLILFVTLAVLARIAPEMNILFISLPMRVGLGLMMATTFITLTKEYLFEYSDWMGKLLPL